MEKGKNVLIEKKVKNSVNVHSNKISLLDKLKKSLGDKEISTSTYGQIYKFPENVKGDIKKEKSFRTNMRNVILNNHLNKIVRSGKINSNLENDIKSFQKDYKIYWLIQDFKIDSFTNCRSDELKKEYVILLDTLKQYVEISK